MIAIIILVKLAIPPLGILTCPRSTARVQVAISYLAIERPFLRLKFKLVTAAAVLEDLPVAAAGQQDGSNRMAPPAVSPPAARAG